MFLGRRAQKGQLAQDPLGQNRDRYEIENKERRTITRRYLTVEEVKDYRAKGFKVTAIDTEPALIEDNDTRLAKSMLAKDGSMRAGGTPFPMLHGKKWFGRRSTTTASLYSHVCVQQMGSSGKILTYRFPRDMVEIKN